jgi:hypothetical protein
MSVKSSDLEFESRSGYIKRTVSRMKLGTSAVTEFDSFKGLGGGAR